MRVGRRVGSARLVLDELAREPGGIFRSIGPERPPAEAEYAQEKRRGEGDQQAAELGPLSPQTLVRGVGRDVADRTDFK